MAEHTHVPAGRRGSGRSEAGRNGDLMPAEPALVRVARREAGGFLAAASRAAEAAGPPEQDGLAGLLAVETALELEDVRGGALLMNPNLREEGDTAEPCG